MGTEQSPCHSHQRKRAALLAEEKGPLRTHAPGRCTLVPMTEESSHTVMSFLHLQIHE